MDPFKDKELVYNTVDNNFDKAILRDRDPLDKNF